MDQIKIGKFIRECRKEKGVTQAELAETLSVSDKTISKWECGGGMPEVSLMMPLCKELGISVNELLSGKRLKKEQYEEEAEANLLDALSERKSNKRLLLLSILSILSTLLGAITIMTLAAYLEMPAYLRGILIGIALVIIGMGIVVGCFLDRRAGFYQCPRCEKTFVPSMSAYVRGLHSLTTRMLKCPHCGKTSFCKRKLGAKTERKEK